MTSQFPRGAIATSHHLATEAGAAAIEAGGNALDAAIAAAAALCVLYPNNVALGGDLVALVRSPDGQVRFLNATGTGADDETLENLRTRHGSRLPLRGIDTVTLPGGVRGWEALHKLGANLSWSEALAPALRFAREGAPLAGSVARALVQHQDEFMESAGARDVFYPNGEPIAEGMSLKQPALAESLETLCAEGADSFYSGSLAQRWIAGLQKLGSRISLSDSARYEVEWGDPLEASFAGHRVMTSPPNTQGFSLLRSLEAIESQGLRDPLGRNAGELTQAFFESNQIRDALLSDPRLGGLSGRELISHPVDMQGPEVNDPVASGDTVGLSAVTSDGWAVSLINSVFHAFGSFVLEPQTGILFQNRGTSFSLDPASPNAFAPGKRPLHTLMPVLVLKGNDLAWVPATMGGQAQPQIHAQLILRVIDGADPTTATHAPRWVVGRQLDGDTQKSVTIEDGVVDATIRSLEDAGFTLTTLPYPSEPLGHSNLIAVNHDGYLAASDPRSDGSAVVVE